MNNQIYRLAWEDLTEDAQERVIEHVNDVLINEYNDFAGNLNGYATAEDYAVDNLDNELFRLSHSIDNPNRIEFAF